MKGYNPDTFVPGDKVISIYTGIHYTVLEPDKNGMSLLLNEDSKVKETWNTYNNAHFHKLEGQLNLFF